MNKKYTFIRIYIYKKKIIQSCLFIRRLNYFIMFPTGEIKYFKTRLNTVKFTVISQYFAEKPNNVRQMCLQVIRFLRGTSRCRAVTIETIT